MQKREKKVDKIYSNVPVKIKIFKETYCQSDCLWPHQLVKFENNKMVKIACTTVYVMYVKGSLSLSNVKTTK